MVRKSVRRKVDKWDDIKELIKTGADEELENWFRTRQGGRYNAVIEMKLCSFFES